MDKDIDPINSKSKFLCDRMDKAQRLFQIQSNLPANVLHEAICLRMEMLSAAVEVMTRAEFTSADARLLQCYGWALNEMVDDLKELCYCVWERKSL